MNSAPLLNLPAKSFRAMQWRAKAELARKSLRDFLTLFFSAVAPGRTLQPGFYLDAMCEFIESLHRGEFVDGQIWTPPGTLKSIICSVCYPAWTWASAPAVQFVCGANDAPIAVRDSIATRNLITDPSYWAAYVQPDPDKPPLWTLEDDQDTKTWFNNTRRGWRQIVTTGGNVTGKKGDVLILDDPMDARKVYSEAYRRTIHQWTDEAFWNRVNDYVNCRHLMTGQRTHVDDSQAHAYARGSTEVLELPEEWHGKRRVMVNGWTDPRTEDGQWLRPERFGPAQAAAEKKRMGPAGYAAQHEQQPRRQEGKLFPRGCVKIVAAVPPGLDAVRFWDTASGTKETDCYTSSVLLAAYTGETGQGRFVVCHAYRNHMGPAERDQTIKNYATTDLRFPGGLKLRKTLFELQPGHAGADQAKLFTRFMAGYAVEAVKSSGDKFVRAQPLVSSWTAGNIDLLAGDWNEWFLDAMEAFAPGSSANELDTGDAAAGAYNFLSAAPTGVDVGTAGRPMVDRMPAGTFNTPARRIDQDRF